MKKNEVAHYPEIMKFIESQLQSNFLEGGINDISIYWKSGELTAKIKELIHEYPDECLCMDEYSKKTPPLNLDIFCVVTNGENARTILFIG